ncbi:unnamed protein product [Wickerhamomyces anomalus]
MTLEVAETIADIVPSFRLDGRIAVVTGGAGGLAITLTRALLSQGAHIALVDLNQQVCDAAAQDLALWGQNQGLNPLPNISSWSCNIGNADEVELTVSKINEYYNDVADLLIHTAGYCQNYTALEYPNQKAADLVQVNLVLIGSMSGVIVNDPQPQVAYNMAKAGVIHLTKSLATEWAKYGIRVNCLSPGYILTPLTKHVIGNDTTLKNAWESKIPMHRMADPKEFVGSVLYFASHDASSYTTGENLIVDGGYQCW